MLDFSLTTFHTSFTCVFLSLIDFPCGRDLTFEIGFHFALHKDMFPSSLPHLRFEFNQYFLTIIGLEKDQLNLFLILLIAPQYNY